MIPIFAVTLLFSTFFMGCESQKLVQNVSGVAEIQSVYIQIVANSTFLKATKESSASLSLGTGKCTLYGGSTVLIKNWPKDDGNHTFVELRNPQPDCKLTQGYVFIQHIARQNQGWFKTRPAVNPNQAAAAAEDDITGKNTVETSKENGTTQSQPVPTTTFESAAISGKRYVCNAPAGLWVRPEPKISSTTLGILPQEQEVTLTGTMAPGWVVVSANNLKGWVSSEFLCTQKPTNTAPTTSSGKFFPNCSTQGITAKLPVKSTGLETYSYDELVYGTCRTIERLKELGRRMLSKTGLPIYVGDISAYGGGNLGRHATHSYGDDIDLAVMGNTTNTECYSYTSSCYNRNASRMLIKEIIDMGGLTSICFNDPAIINEFPNHVRYCSGHNDHYHIEWHN
jgi:hypothetical protein